MQAIDAISIVATGGTIDSVFHPQSEGKVISSSSGVPDYLRDFIKPPFSMRCTQICMLDSKLLTDEIRTQIAEAVIASIGPYVLILHGTDTMAVTAAFLDQYLPKNHNKTVILTGSMIPLEGFLPSDAAFNLGFAMGRFGALEAGVYVCMNAATFRAGTVVKNAEAGRFEVL